MVTGPPAASIRLVTAARPASTARHWSAVIRRARPAAVAYASPGTGVISLALGLALLWP